MKWKTTSIAIVVIVIVVAVALFAYFNYGAGILEIKMVDPIVPEAWGDATQVYLNYSAVEIHRSQPDNESGWYTVIDVSAWINLTRTLSVNQTIGAKNLQAGVYNLIRFRILEARVTVNRANYTATVPSGQLTIAVTQGGVRVNAGQNSALLIDINVKVEGSIAGGIFRIVPAVRATPI